MIEVATGRGNSLACVLQMGRKFMNAHVLTPETNRSKSDATPSTPLPADQVAVIAYHLYLEDGCQDGRDQEHWYRAEQILKESVTNAVEQAVRTAARVESSVPPSAKLTKTKGQRQTTTRGEVRRHHIPTAPRHH
jgi:hypothetical protein